MSPQGFTNADPVILNLVTDEEAACRYDTLEIEYEFMTYVAGADDDNLIHEATLALPDGEYTYYVACEDTSGNAGAPA